MKAKPHSSPKPRTRTTNTILPCPQGLRLELAESFDRVWIGSVDDCLRAITHTLASCLKIFSSHRKLRIVAEDSGSSSHTRRPDIPVVRTPSVLVL